MSYLRCKSRSKASSERVLQARLNSSIVDLSSWRSLAAKTNFAFIVCLRWRGVRCVAILAAEAFRSRVPFTISFLGGMQSHQLRALELLELVSYQSRARGFY